MAKLLAFVAFFIGAISAADAPPKHGNAHAKVVQLSEAIQQSTHLMVKGVEKFLQELHDEAVTRKAKTLVEHSGGHFESNVALNAADTKAQKMAQSIVANLKSLDKVAGKLATVSKGENKTEVTPNTAPVNARLQRLEQQNRGLLKMNKETEAEKEDLIHNVQDLIRKAGSNKEERMELETAKEEIKRLQARVAALEADGNTTTSTAAALRRELEQCRRSGGTPADTPEETVAPNAELCGMETVKLRDSEKKLTAEKKQLEDTVQIMLRQTREAEAKASASKAPATECKCDKSSDVFDLQHMGDSVKIDEYIAQNDITGAIKATTPKDAPATTPKDAPASGGVGFAATLPKKKYEKSIVKISKDDPAPVEDKKQAKLRLTPGSQSAIAKALSKAGDVQKYLDSDPVDPLPEQAVQSDVDDLVSHDDSDDDLARKMLLQAENTIKLVN